MRFSTTVLVCAGKLGHGDTERVYRPKIIESLAGLYIRKVVCASQYSLALTYSGQVTQAV